ATIRTLRLIGIAESIYSRRNAAIGFTCNLADLVNLGKGIDDNGPYSFLDPAFATGVSNGYQFLLSGCDGQPASKFQIIAEPISGKGSAFCSDASHAIRISGDGKGATCLVSGKLALRYK